MSLEQLDAVKDQLMSDDNAEILEKLSSVWLEDPERGAEMIITFATDKGLKLDATADELVDHLENLDDDEDIELTPEMLADIAGGRRTNVAMFRRAPGLRKRHNQWNQWAAGASMRSHQGFH